jgi:hypothetical protein
LPKWPRERATKLLVFLTTSSGILTQKRNPAMASQLTNRTKYIPCNMNFHPSSVLGIICPPKNYSSLYRFCRTASSNSSSQDSRNIIAVRRHDMRPSCIGHDTVRLNVRPRGVGETAGFMVHSFLFCYTRHGGTA